MLFFSLLTMCTLRPTHPPNVESIPTVRFNPARVLDHSFAANPTFGRFLVFSLIGDIFFFLPVLSVCSFDHCYVFERKLHPAWKLFLKREQKSLTAAYSPWLLLLRKFHPTLLHHSLLRLPHVLTAPTYSLSDDFSHFFIPIFHSFCPQLPYVQPTLPSSPFFCRPLSFHINSSALV